MTDAGSVLLAAPLAGWSTPLEEAPDEVFAARMLGDGLAVDPTGNTVYAPCDGEVTLIAQAHHALTLRTAHGAEILMHVGIDTVALGGEGFALRVTQGARVRLGDPLLSFDLDLLARRARSLLTPIIVSAESGYRILRRSLDREVNVGEFLMEIAPAAAAAASATAERASPALTRRVVVRLAHGLHARPAALLAAAVRNLAADVRIGVRGREANARSTIALMGLDVQRGDEIELQASGPDATAALDALTGALATATEREGSHAAAAPAPGLQLLHAAPAAHTSSAPAGTLRGVIASRGLGVGPAVQLRRPELSVAEAGTGAAQENAALDQARVTVRARLERRAATSSAAGRSGATQRCPGAYLPGQERRVCLATVDSLARRGAAFAP
jgi:phosphotransferase system HPr (HPr) family protein